MSDSPVTADDVRYAASLARITIPDEDVEAFASQFGEILDAFETLDDVPSVDRETDLRNVLRPDEQEASLDRDRALGNAPESEDGYFKGPSVS